MLAMTFALQAAVTMLAAAVPVLALEVARAQGWNIGLLGAYPTLLYLGTLAGSLCASSLLAWLGAFGLSLGCVTLGSIGLLGILPGAPLPAAIGAILIGFANGPMTAASSQILTPLSNPRSISLVLAIKQTGVPVGAMLAGVVAPFLAVSLGWRVATLALCIASLALAVLLLPARARIDAGRPPRRAKRDGALHGLRALLAVPGMRGIVLASMAFASAQLILRTFIASFAVLELGAGLVMGGLLLSLSQGAGIVGQVGWAMLSDRWCRPHATLAVIGLLMALAAGLTATAAEDWSPLALCAVALLFGLTAAGYRPVALAAVAAAVPATDVGSLTAAHTTFSTASILVGPLVFGMIVGLAGFAAGFVACALLALLGTAALLPTVGAARRVPSAVGEPCGGAA